MTDNFMKRGPFQPTGFLSGSLDAQKITTSESFFIHEQKNFILVA